MPNPVDDPKERRKKKWGVFETWLICEHSLDSGLTYNKAQKKAAMDIDDRRCDEAFLVYIP